METVLNTFTRWILVAALMLAYWPFAHRAHAAVQPFERHVSDDTTALVSAPSPAADDGGATLARFARAAVERGHRACERAKAAL